MKRAHFSGQHWAAGMAAALEVKGAWQAC